MAGGGHFRDLGCAAHGGLGAAELAATAAAREGAAASEGQGHCLGGENHLYRSLEAVAVRIKTQGDKGARIFITHLSLPVVEEVVC